MSAETRAKMRAAKLGSVTSPETRARMSAAKKGRPAHNKGTKASPETRARISLAGMGRAAWNKGLKTGHAPWLGKTRGPHSEVTRARMRAAALGKPKSVEHAAHILQNWCPGRAISYRGLTLKSSYEVRVARALDLIGVEWEYEPRRFDLGRCSYTPDFYFPRDDVFWEVKGYLGSKSVFKTDLLRQMYPSVRLVIITKSDIEAIERGDKAYPGLPSQGQANHTPGQFANGMKSLFPQRRGKDGGGYLEDHIGLPASKGVGENGVNCGNPKVPIGATGIRSHASQECEERFRD